jgi:hypothetical protein
MSLFKYSAVNHGPLQQNDKHQFAMCYGMNLFNSNSIYSFIPKNGCSTMRLSVAKANGCIDSIEDGHWIHNNNQTFVPTLQDAVRANYKFVILRCPFRRLASLFLDKFVSKEPDAWAYRETLQNNVELDDLTFRNFVRSLKKPFVFNSNIHWRLQTDFLIYEEYSDYFSFENFLQMIATLKKKINFDVIDARELTSHGTNKYQKINDQCYADVASFNIAIMKRNGQCPSHESLYDKELFDLVSRLYSNDIELYKTRCQQEYILNINEVVNPILNIKTVKFDDIKYNFDVDFLRDEAIKLESTNLTLAFKLMSLAHQARPDGPFIEGKCKEYKKQLSDAED